MGAANLTTLAHQLASALKALESAAEVAASVNTILDTHVRLLPTYDPNTKQYYTAMGAVLGLYEVLDHAGVSLSPDGLAIREALFPWYVSVSGDGGTKAGSESDAEVKSDSDIAQYYRDGDDLVVRIIGADGETKNEFTAELFGPLFTDASDSEFAVAIAKSLAGVDADFVFAISPPGVGIDA